MKFSLSFLATGGLLVALAGSASAHITLMYPTPRTVQPLGQKGAPPCGDMGPRKPTTFRPGETIMVKWDETISHVGRFRVAFDDEGMDFPAPLTRKDTNTTLPIFLDGLFEKTKEGPKGLHEQAITFPNKPCANCTLQVIQVMVLDPPYQTSAHTNVYYQCADIVLAGEPMGGGGADAGTPPADDAGAGGASGTGGAGGASAGTGGATSGTGGAVATGGSGGGNGTTGGSTGSGASGGSTGSGASGGSGGSRNTGGSTGSGNASGGSAGSPTSSGDSGPSTGGCSLGGNQSVAAFGLMAIAGLILRLQRRR